MTHLSDHDLWTAGGNRVATMVPGPGDLFVVTTMFGKRVLVEPIGQYERAVRIAEAFARRLTDGRPVTIKVLPMSFAELLAHIGTTRDEFAKGLSPEGAEADRRLAIDACMGALRESDDPAVRAEACEVLVEMGVLKE